MRKSVATNDLYMFCYDYSTVSENLQDFQDRITFTVSRLYNNLSKLFAEFMTIIVVWEGESKWKKY